jgi:FlaA1/EpsC-like NDP-sugar epimerase
VLVRYGNVIASRGSVIPLFSQQIRSGGPVTLTDTRMTRFLFTLSQAVDAICAAIRHGTRAEMFIPRIPSGRVSDVAAAMIGDRKIETKVTGIRPGEKIHEVLISIEESPRCSEREGYYVIAPMLPEIAGEPVIHSRRELWEYSSGNDPLDAAGVRDLLAKHGILDLANSTATGEVLR